MFEEVSRGDFLFFYDRLLSAGVSEQKGSPGCYGIIFTLKTKAYAGKYHAIPLG